MKKTIAILLAVMLLLAVIPATSFAAGVASNGKTSVYRVKTNGGTLQLRSGPSTKYRILRSLKNGTAFYVLKSSGNWYRIKTYKGGYVGWVSKSWTARNAYARVTTKVQGLNVRSGPSTNYAIRGSMPKGAKNVKVKYTSGNWAYITSGRLTGYVSLNYLRF